MYKRTYDGQGSGDGGNQCRWDCGSYNYGGRGARWRRVVIWRGRWGCIVVSSAAAARGR
jgi:hypothetical protein